MLGLPRLQPQQARARRRARARRDDDGLAVGLRVSAARPLPQELRRRHGPAGRARPGHGRPARQLRARVQRQVLRGPRLPRARQLLGELQRAGDALRRGAAQGLGGAQLLLQHGLRRRQPVHGRRAVVAARRLRAAAGLDRPGVRLVGLPRRHRPGQRLGDHRHPRPRLLAREPVLAGDRPPRHPGGRPRHDQRDRLPPAHVGADPRLRRVPRATGFRTASRARARSPSTGPAGSGRRSWTSRRCASGRWSAPTPSS